jgi:hypothetical protein
MISTRPIGSDVINHTLGAVRAEHGTAEAIALAEELIASAAGIIAIERGPAYLKQILRQAEQCALLVLEERRTSGKRH